MQEVICHCVECEAINNVVIGDALYEGEQIIEIKCQECKAPLVIFISVEVEQTGYANGFSF